MSRPFFLLHFARESLYSADSELLYLLNESFYVFAFCFREFLVFIAEERYMIILQNMFKHIYLTLIINKLDSTYKIQSQL